VLAPRSADWYIASEREATLVYRSCRRPQHCIWVGADTPTAWRVVCDRGPSFLLVYVAGEKELDIAQALLDCQVCNVNYIVPPGERELEVSPRTCSHIDESSVVTLACNSRPHLQGSCALSRAIEAKDYEMVKLLVLRGANIHTKLTQGTVLDQCAADDMRTMLLALGTSLSSVATRVSSRADCVGANVNPEHGWRPEFHRFFQERARREIAAIIKIYWLEHECLLQLLPIEMIFEICVHLSGDAITTTPCRKARARGQQPPLLLEGGAELEADLLDDELDFDDDDDDRSDVGSIDDDDGAGDDHDGGQQVPGTPSTLL